MSGLPPTIEEQPVSTPASEWADKTKNALATDSSVAPSVSTGGPRGVEDPLPASTAGASTPGVQPPGAYPAGRGSEVSADSAATKAGPAESGTAHKTQEVIEKAMGYVPDDVNRAVQSAGQTASQYLPKSVVDTISPYLPNVPPIVMASAHDHPHMMSLPSKEIQGNQPYERQEGVGSLPGPVSEMGVARLPDERTPVTGTPIGGAQTPVAAAGAAVTPSSASIAGKRAQPSENVGGAGTLPGRVGESGLTVPPDERQGQAEGTKGLEAPTTASGTPSFAQGGKGAEGRRLDEDTKGVGSNDAGAAPRTAGVSGSDRETVTPTAAPAIPPFTENGRGAEGHHVDEDVTATGTPAGVSKDGSQAQEVPSTAKATAVKDEVKGSATHATAGEAADEEGDKDKVRHDPVKVNLQPREWRTWQGVGGHISQHDADLAESNDDGEPDHDALGLSDDRNAKDQVVQPAPSAHSDITETNRTDTSESSVSAEPPHKPKFMERVKGEAKVLAGKLGGDQHKVDEGKKLKTGGV